LVLLRRFDTCQDLLDADANLLATCNLLDFTNGTLLVPILERAGCPQNVCELLLRVDVWYRDLGIETTEEV